MAVSTLAPNALFFVRFPCRKMVATPRTKCVSADTIYRNKWLRAKVYSVGMSFE
jgi:hypothetical protein